MSEIFGQIVMRDVGEFGQIVMRDVGSVASMRAGPWGSGSFGAEGQLQRLVLLLVLHLHKRCRLKGPFRGLFDRLPVHDARPLP